MPGSTAPSLPSPSPAMPEALLNGQLLAGLLEHLACYIQTGRPKSAHLASMLLERLATDPTTRAELGEYSQHLGDVLADRLRQSHV